MQTIELTKISLMSACLCLICPLSISIGPIPISLASFMVMVTGYYLGSKNATKSIVLYIMIGCIGLPVFAGFKSGFTTLFGITGGYIIGYIPLAFFSGIQANSHIHRIGYILMGTLLLYGIGLIWFQILTSSTFTESFLICVLPFIPADIIKILLFLIIQPKLKKDILT